MKIKKIRVPYYKWFMKVVIADNHNEVDAVLKEAKAFTLSQQYQDAVKDKFENSAMDGADLYYNEGRLEMLLIVYPHSSVRQLVSTLIHEGRHAADEVINTTGLEGSESAAYLTENITFKLVKDYIKDE